MKKQRKQAKPTQALRFTNKQLERCVGEGLYEQYLRSSGANGGYVDFTPKKGTGSIGQKFCINRAGKIVPYNPTLPVVGVVTAVTLQLRSLF